MIHNFFNIFRVYFAKGDTLDEKYLASTKENFLAEPVATDFGNEEEARNSINKWVEAQTNSKIQELIARNVLTPLTKLVLVNAIHFKGDWETKFDKENTHEADFHVSKDKTVKAQMMFSNEKFPYLPLRELKADALGECPAAHSTVWKIEKFTLKLIFQHFRIAL